MNAWLVALTTLIYVGVAVGYYHDGRTGMCIAFSGYAAANIGFIIDIITKGH